MHQQMNSWTHFLHIYFYHISSNQLESVLLPKPLLIFSQIFILSSVSGNFTTSISDHLPQFLVVPDIFKNFSPPKSNIYERDWNNFDQENFILDYLTVDWADVTKSEKKITDFSIECFLKKSNLIHDKYLPLKKITKQKLKFKTKPWIRPDLQKSISIKNKLLTKFIKLKEPLKSEAHTKYKLYRNFLAILLKRSKHTYLSPFFQNHISDLYLKRHKNNNFFGRFFIYSPIHCY